MIFWVMMTNQIHKWSHLDEERIPATVRALQRLHLVLPPAHHRRHHTAPFDTYYCITTGWLNWPLARLGFFRHLERAVTAVFGLVPRQEDLGLDGGRGLDGPVA
jgi:ubiquitin-conjugating enzyme E2 variant